MLRNFWRGCRVVVGFSLMLAMFGCGGATSAPFTGSDALQGVTVTLSPRKVNLRTNAPQLFTATVNNTNETGVTWLINGLPGGKQLDGSYPYGTIDSGGNYIAPPYVPIPPVVTVTAAANADNNARASASVSIRGSRAPGSVTISPTTASVEAAGIVPFTATVNRKYNTVDWLVNNTLGGDLNVGTIYQVPGSPDHAIYVAPLQLPGAGVTVTAVSRADPSQFALALVTITRVQGAVVTIINPQQSPTVPVGKDQAFQASVTGVGDTTVSWEVDGIRGGNGHVGRIVPGANDTATYTAPAGLPNPPQVIVTAVSNAQPAASASMIVNVVEGQPVKVVVSPDPCTNPDAVPISSTVQFTATVSGESDQSVTWEVDGAVGGDLTDGTITTDGLYTAPASVPANNPVTITAVSQAAPSVKGDLPITITTTSVLAVKLSPKSATVDTGGGQDFTATVEGATDVSQAEVNWLVNGINGGNSTYGTISPESPVGCMTDATYLAPENVPNPDRFPITAQSNYDSSKSDSATVTIVKAPPLKVNVDPNNINVVETTQQMFNATVQGATDQNVFWSLSGEHCSGEACGTLDNAGPSTTTTYTAPAVAPLEVTLTAVAEADRKTKGTATINVTCGGQPSISIYPNSAGIDANSPSPLSFSAAISPCGNDNLTVTWQLGCISLSDGTSGEDCFDSEFSGGGPGCTQINNGAKVCGARANQGPGTDPLSYYSPTNLFTKQFYPNACEETNNGSGNGQVPLTATVTINQQPYTSPPACITVCPAGSSSCTP